mmetsp:Transcript_13317/g.41772  ORF Transcript_13317/g.41772 Transcript_13317/m.41772 type:complete len:258 (-) Transcript_13317:398-1171(-)
MTALVSPPLAAESKPPKHHRMPPYEGGAWPSSANLLLRWMRRASASSGAALHACTALPHVMRQLLCNSPLSTSALCMASHSGKPLSPASSTSSGMRRGRRSASAARKVCCAHGGSASSVPCVAGRRKQKAYESSRHVCISSRNLCRPPPASLAAAARATAKGLIMPALRYADMRALPPASSGSLRRLAYVFSPPAPSHARQRRAAAPCPPGVCATGCTDCSTAVEATSALIAASEETSSGARGRTSRSSTSAATGGA